MDIKRLIRIEQAKQGSITDSELAERCGWSQQSYSQRLSRGSMKVKDLEKVADALGCDLVITFEPREK